MSKKFSDFATSDALLDGKKIKIAEIVDKEIEVIGFMVSDSKIKQNEKCLKLQFYYKEEKHVIFTGSNILINQCVKYEKEMPFIATIKVAGKCFTFS
jgi:hypothetical protein